MPESSNPIEHLPNSDWCFVCGEANQAGLQTRFYVEGDKVKAKLTAQEHHCGYKNTIHGGVIAAVLDECMGWAAARAIGRLCLTAELTIRYLGPVPDNQELTVITEITKANRRLVKATGEIQGADGKTYARAEGKFTPLSAEETLLVDDQLNYRGHELRIFDHLRKTAKDS